MALRVYSTLTKEKTDFEPVVPGKVGIYLCGPTVYKPSHIGHMVGPVIFDVVKRYLAYNGYDVTLVVNITDVDDKLIQQSQERKLTMAQVADEMTADYQANLAAMGIDTIDHFPKATEHMDGIISFIEELIERGYAYPADGDVFFEVTKDKEYGKLSGRSVDQMQGEGGGAAAKKRTPFDFALWKAAKPGEPSWTSPWGEGRPGWHIECSAMSHKILGKTFDIHGGGLDLVFPHHENEVAQSECCHDAPQAKYWFHNGLVQAADQVGKVGGRNTAEAEAKSLTEDQAEQEAGKMGKSKGAQAFRELLEQHSGETIRFFVIGTHYRSPIYYSEDALRAAHENLAGFYRFFQRFERITGASFYDLPRITSRDAGGTKIEDESLNKVAQAHRDRFLELMDDDFNTAGARAELFEFVKDLNRTIDEQKLEDPAHRDAAKLEHLKAAASAFRELAGMLGLFLKPVAAQETGDELVGDLLQMLVELRASARNDKLFAVADGIRDGMKELNVALEDRADGTGWTLPDESDGLADNLVGLAVKLRQQARDEKNYGLGDRIRDGLSELGVKLEDRNGETGWTIDSP